VYLIESAVFDTCITVKTIIAGRRDVTVPLEECLLYYSVHMYIVFFFIFAHLCSNICIKILHVCIY